MSRRDFFQLFCMFYLRLINRKCVKEKKQQYLMLYQTWNRTSVYFKLAVSASYGKVQKIRFTASGRNYIVHCIFSGVIRQNKSDRSLQYKVINEPFVQVQMSGARIWYIGYLLICVNASSSAIEPWIRTNHVRYTGCPKKMSHTEFVVITTSAAWF